MCGIIGYIGNRNAYPLLIKGLKRLEYRGYDSAGVALYNEGTKVYKCKGKVNDLENYVIDKDIKGKIGIAHTRWATHGMPSDENAHPHTSMNGHFTIIHNGIIENYAELKKQLEKRSYVFLSNTDTEVLANLIEHIYLNEKIDAEIAIRLALSKVIGAYGLVIICNDEKEKLFAARKSSPLVIGVGKSEYFIASDATPIIEYTDKVIYLDDDQITIIKKEELVLKNIDNITLEPTIHKIDLNIEEISKGGYDYFMLKEIFEQPYTLRNTLSGRISEENTIHLGGISEKLAHVQNTQKIIIVACGTSWHAGLVGEYMFEEYARICVEVEYASEFRYRNPIINKNDVVIAISQSGETADTLAAIKLAKQSGATIIGICNVVGSSISRETDAGIYTHAGVEIGVASTKAFTSQVSVLAMLALLLAQNNAKIPSNELKLIISNLKQLPDIVEQVLTLNDKIKDIAKLYKDVTNAIYLGRGTLFPVALEGALKLKEISYIHAEGYPAAEMKHGPIALIDEHMPVIIIAIKDEHYSKVVSNIEEVKARKGKIIAIVSEGDKIISKIADHVLEVPNTHKILASLITIVPLQLLSYHIAVMRGCNVDQPRNLAKSVTVE